MEKWWNEVCGRGKREKPREKPTQTPFRPPPNPHGGTETRTRDPSGERRASNRLRHEAALISVLLTGFRYFSYQAATQFSSRGWVDPVPDPIILEKYLGYSRKTNPGPLRWQ